MIRYTLKCENGHVFESWFQSASAYDSLSKAGHLCCEICGTAEVSKTIMAPQVRVRKGDAPAPQPGPAAASDTTSVTAGPLSGPGTEMAQAVAKLRAEVEKNSTYVGKDFAQEARKMHLGEAPERQIHGEATAKDARSLIEDGVPVLPLPGVPKSKTN